ncbi:SNF2 family N-terminal domain-containing protein [Crassisporium funariophilum]|nr:SNF2 family N-terminal domain-containing protein [Crassisporium funariophilum]
MPMEHIRKRFAEDVNLYPEFGGPRKTGQQSKAISIGSTSSSSSVPPSKPPAKAPIFQKKSTVIISSDEEGDGDEDNSAVEIMPGNFNNAPTKAAPIPLHTRVQNMLHRTHITEDLPPKPVPQKQSGVPIHIPSNRDYFPGGFRPGPPIVPPVSDNIDGENIKLPDFRDDNAMMTAGDAEKALRELMGGGMNTELDANIEIDMSEAVVEGFKEGITLMPHQILGRAWMKDREDLTKKRTGGILADDMGLGKTIQTLTRIVEGRPRKSDKADGWSGSTLVICPLALVGQWADEIQKMTNLRVLKHQGTSRTTDPLVLQKYHVVVTTYDTVKSEYMSYSPAVKDESKVKAATSSKQTSPNDSDDDSEEDGWGRTKKPAAKAKAGAKKSALYHVKWWRIVLDEAHNIKNVKTKGAAACCELQSKFRWCLTGTPMQNNVTELYSLIKFLRIKPLSVWDTFNEQIAKPVNSGRGASRAMKRLQVVLKQIMLRRRKDQVLNGKPLIQLPKRTVNVISCEFDPSEEVFYNSLENRMEDVIEKLMEQGKSNYMSVLLLLLRLRQACNHPILVADDYKKDADAVDPKAVAKGKDDNDVDPDDLVAAFGQMGVTRKCQMCTIELHSSNTGEGEWNTHCRNCAPLAIKAKRDERERPSSAKIRMILKLLKDIDERSDCEEKTIIFSQFTSMLNLIEPFLAEKGVKYVRYDGSMNTKDREASLAMIKSSASTRVILISFKAGSTGLNLTACNNVILVDLWWNPALEDQAFDRSHRFGQTRDVNIFKLKIDGTVEDRILLLQDKKRALAAAALSGDKIKNMRLGMEDLLALFRPGGRDDDEESEED